MPVAGGRPIVKRLLWSVCIVQSVALAASTRLSAQSAADFYAAKKNLTIIIASGVGGGYDTYARSFARHFGRHVAGNPNIVLQNMEGASGLEATNYVANKAPRDGTTILATYNSLLILPLFDKTRAFYEVRTMNWIGSIAKATEDCFTWHTSSIKTIEQAKMHEVLMGSTGATGDSAIFPKLLNSLVGTKFRTISGYSTNAQYLAIERGEVEGSCGLGQSTVAAAKPDWVSGHKMNYLVQFGLAKVPAMENAPLATELVGDENDKKIFELLAYPQEMGRPFAAPPGVPADRVAALRTAFDKTMRDPDFLADSAKASQAVQPMQGEAVASMLQQAYATPNDVIARYNALIADAR